MVCTAERFNSGVPWRRLYAGWWSHQTQLIHLVQYQILHQQNNLASFFTSSVKIMLRFAMTDFPFLLFTSFLTADLIVIRFLPGTLPWIRITFFLEQLVQLQGFGIVTRNATWRPAFLPEYVRCNRTHRTWTDGEREPWAIGPRDCPWRLITPGKPYLRSTSYVNNVSSCECFQLWFQRPTSKPSTFLNSRMKRLEPC